MGMSAYGEVSPEHLKILNDHWDMMTSIPTEKEKRELAQYAWLEREDFSEEGITQNTRLMGKRMQWSWKNKFNNLKDEDIAATIQKFTEDKIIEIMKFARKHGNKLIYSGGVVIN
jgi:predicted NodU family carbamoyl transferase